jgi:hypothetical protein
LHLGFGLGLLLRLVLLGLLSRSLCASANRRAWS